MDKQPNGSRRAFVRKAIYVTPAVLTLAVAPSYAKAGSVKEERASSQNGVEEGTTASTAPTRRMRA